jgi:hypothetical protein
VTVPELLLKQEQRTRTIFNFVLGAIASISLIVGGIGIMKHHASRRSSSASARSAFVAPWAPRRRTSSFQFLAEAVLISMAGGIAGILLALRSALHRAHRRHHVDCIRGERAGSVRCVVQCGIGLRDCACAPRGAAGSLSHVYDMSDRMKNTLRMAAALLMVAVSAQPAFAQPATAATALTLQDAINMAQQQGAQAKARRRCSRCGPRARSRVQHAIHAVVVGRRSAPRVYAIHHSGYAA